MWSRRIVRLYHLVDRMCPVYEHSAEVSTLRWRERGIILFAFPFAWVTKYTEYATGLSNKENQGYHMSVADDLAYDSYRQLFALRLQHIWSE